MAERQSNDPFGNMSSIRDSAPSGHEMNQNIKLGEGPSNIDAKVNLEESNTQRTSDTDQWDSALGTLDEPVSETIVSNILFEVSPLFFDSDEGLEQNLQEIEDRCEPILTWCLSNRCRPRRKKERSQELGPLGPFHFLPYPLSVSEKLTNIDLECLFSVLSSGTAADDKTLLFEIVFIIVWLGGGIIAING